MRWGVGSLAVFSLFDMQWSNMLSPASRQHAGTITITHHDAVTGRIINSIVAALLCWVPMDIICPEHFHSLEPLRASCINTHMPLPIIPKPCTNDQVVNSRDRNLLVADTYLKYAKGRKTIAFCCDMKHADDLAAVFRWVLGAVCSSVHLCRGFEGSEP